MKHLDDHRSAALLEAATEAMVCVSADGRIALANAQAERLFGYRHDELVGEPVEILVPDAARGAHQQSRAGYVADPRTRPMGAGLELAGLQLRGIRQRRGREGCSADSVASRPGGHRAGRESCSAGRWPDPPATGLRPS